MHHLTNTPANTPARADDPPLDFHGPHEQRPRGDCSRIYLRALLLQRLVDAGLADPGDPEMSLARADAQVVQWLINRNEYLVVRVVVDLIARAHDNGLQSGSRRKSKDLYRALDELTRTWTSAADAIEEYSGPDDERGEALRDCVDGVQGVITRDVLAAAMDDGQMADERIEGAR